MTDFSALSRVLKTAAKAEGVELSAAEVKHLAESFLPRAIRHVLRRMFARRVRLMCVSLRLVWLRRLSLGLIMAWMLWR